MAAAELALLHDCATKCGLKVREWLWLRVAHCLASRGEDRDRTAVPNTSNQIMWHGQTRLTGIALGHEM